MPISLRALKGGRDMSDEMKRNRRLDAFLDHQEDERRRGITLEIAMDQLQEVRGDVVDVKRWQHEHEQRDDERIRALHDELRESMSDVKERVVKLEAHREHTASDVDKLEEQVDRVRDDSGTFKNVDQLILNQIETINARRSDDAERIKTLEAGLAAMATARKVSSSKPPRPAPMTAMEMVKIGGAIVGTLAAQGSAMAAFFRFIWPVVKAAFRIH